ncbi:MULTISPECIES: hypothetical protein [Bacillus]|uniref:hypothetical protein n=1 Tax=Bacillus TaxID=1386 RepID=UPI000BB85064|nr:MULTISPECIES: hypothetical protein [Bacillus]
MEELHPKYPLASIAGKAKGDSSWYVKETHGKMTPEFEAIWCQANLNSLTDEYPTTITNAMFWFRDDVQEVLQYHKVFYAKTVAFSTTGSHQQKFANFPYLVTFVVHKDYHTGLNVINATICSVVFSIKYIKPLE